MNIGKLGDAISYPVVDVPGNLSSLNMRQRNIHIDGCDGRGNGFEAVGDRDHYIGTMISEKGGEFDCRETGRFRRCGAVFDIHQVGDLG
ncbi:hypothetical protein D3C86_1991230 [compost metagenome]